MGVVVGRTYDLNHLDNAFMYVHATGRMYDLNHLDNTAEWVDLETNSPTVEWFAQNATGINESNQIVGTATNIDPNVVNRYYVLHDPLGPNPTFQLLSSFGNTDTSFSGRINDHGVVVGKLSGGVIVYDPANNYEPVDTGGTIPPRDINNDGVIVCGGGDVPAQIIEPIGLGYVVHEFPEFQPLAFSGINDLGIVTGFQFETGRGRNKVPGGPIRFDFERYQQNPTTVPELLITTGGYNFNWRGDVNFFGDIYFGHDGRELVRGELTVMLIAQGDDLSHWTRLHEAVRISADGRTIIGNGTNINGDPEAFVATLIADVTTIVPDSLSVTRGTSVSGGVAELAESDNADLALQRATADIQSRTEFEVKSISPVATPASLEVTLEGAVFARSQVNQTIELFDYVAAAWEQVDTRAATRFMDSTVTIEATGDLSRFVEPGTMYIEARIRYQSTNPRQQFSSNTDQFIWTIGQ